MDSKKIMNHHKDPSMIHKVSCFLRGFCRMTEGPGLDVTSQPQLWFRA